MNYRELPTISKKQKEIMDLVYKFRFVNREQLQRLFGHKDASRLNKWLKDLVEKKYLGRIYSHKLLENTKPAIYYLNNNGIILVRYKEDGEKLDIKYLKKFYEDKHASQTFVNHCVTLFEFYIQLKKAEEVANKDFIEKRKKLRITILILIKNLIITLKQKQKCGLKNNYICIQMKILEKQNNIFLICILKDSQI